MANENDGRQGFQQVSSDDGGVNTLLFAIRSQLGRLNTATLVKVIAVHTTGRTAASGTVDVTPLVNQLLGDGSTMAHTVIHGLPYFRVQGGVNAVICDPHVGDVGFCVFADRDISGVKKARKAADAGSRRRFDMADGLYFGAWSATAPTSYVLVDDNGIEVMAPSLPVNVTGSAIGLNGDTTITGKLHLTGDMTADAKITATGEVQSGAIKLTTHKHTGVTTGGGTTGTPTP
jgi:hypothetical protein